MSDNNHTENSELSNAADAVVKKKRGNPAFQNLGYDLAEPGDNARFLRHALVAWDLPPIDISDPKQVEHRIREYFQYCLENDRKPQLVGMANWIGVDRDTLGLWKRGEYRKETHFSIIKKAVDLLEEMWTDYMLNGKVNPASGIFIGKNHFSLRDTQDVVITPNNPLDEGNPETVRQRYANAIPERIDDDGTIGTI